MKSKPPITLRLRVALAALAGAVLLTVPAVKLPGDLGVVIDSGDNNHVHSPEA